MNTENKTDNRMHERLGGLIGDHIRSEIAKQPKMNPVVAARVATNMDELLNEIKKEGIAMHDVCFAAALGNRDAKALFKYRNPAGSNPRDYISQAPKYLNLAEAIAGIDDHPYSGTSSAVLRRVFARTPYSPALTDSSDASIALKRILDKTTDWIARQMNLVQAHGQMHALSKMDCKSSASRQFEGLLTINQKGHPLHLELGFRDTEIKDSKGQAIELVNEKNGRYSLCWREDVSLFIGIDNRGIPRPYLAFEDKSLVATPNETFPVLATGMRRYDISLVSDRTHEGAGFGDLVFESRGAFFYLPKEVVARNVDLDSLSQHLKNGDVHFENPYHEANPIIFAFIAANPEYGISLAALGRSIADREIQTMPVTADTLEYVEGFLSGPGGTFAPAGEWQVLGIGGSLLFGNGTLARLINWFKGSGLEYEVNSKEKEFLGDDIPNSPMAPPGGWIGVRPYIFDRFKWSAADLLWLRCKIFVKIVEDRFTAATKQQRAQYDELLQRLEGDGVSQ